MKIQKETRGYKYGKSLAVFVGAFFQILPDDVREEYRKEFLNELGTYHKNHVVRELEEIREFDIKNPVHLAKLIKESFHLMYQRTTSGKALDGFLENL